MFASKVHVSLLLGVALLSPLWLVTGRFTTEQIDELGKACNASQDDLAVAKTYKVPTTESGKCLMKCMISKLGLLNDDGTYNKTGMGEGLKKYWPEWPLDKIELINNKCHDEDALKGFRSMSIPKSQAEKCMMGCLMRKVNVINNGKFSVEEASKIAQKYYGTNQTLMKKAKDLIDVCAKKAQSTSDECTLAGIITTCIVEEADKAGLSVGHGGNRSARSVSPKFHRNI